MFKWINLCTTQFAVFSVCQLLRLSDGIKNFIKEFPHLRIRRYFVECDQ